MSFAFKIKLFHILGIVSGICTTSWAQSVPYKIQPIPSYSAKLPTAITDGSTLSLNCGTTYYGSLNLLNLSNVTIETNGLSPSCGRAVITPAVPVTQWQVYRGNIYVANVPKEVAQVFVDGQITGVAHYPNSLKESGWIQPTSFTSTTVEVSGLPSNDIVGAKATTRGNYPWAIGTRTVTAYDGRTMTLPANTNLDLNAEDSITLGKFYLEGKLWMLDSPGEWAWSNGKLYLWMPDGQFPGNRVLAAPNVEAVINARGTTNLTVKEVRILGGRIGIDGGFSDQKNRGALRLQITNTEIAYSDWSAIYASNSQSLAVDGSQIIGALHTGIYARTSSSNTIVRNSLFVNVNAMGMHKGSDGTIYLNNDYNAKIVNNTITNSGKSGVFIGQSKDSLVKNNRIDGACRVHGDCGGIYLFSRGKIALNTRVEGNLVKNVNGDPARPNSKNPERYGIYLDDYATGTTIIANTITNCDTGMQLHLAYNNQIISNAFAGSLQRHVLFSDSGGELGSMHNNVFDNNAVRGPVLAYYFAVKNPTTAATFIKNIYSYYGSTPVVYPSNVPFK